MSAAPAADGEPARPHPVTQKFAFGGEEFDSQEAAEQNFRSLRGQFKPLAALAKAAGGYDKIAPTLAQAADSARSWKAEHDRIKAELDAVRAQPATQAVDAALPPPSPDADAPDVDWELYAEVKKLATESGEPWKAEQWLIEQTRKAERTRTERLLDDRLAPFESQQKQAAVSAQTEKLFGSLAAYTNADGSPAFPELADATAAYEVGRLWASLGLPAESALTPQGAVAAIAVYRMARANGSQARSAALPSPPASALPAAPAPTDTLSASDLGEGRPLVASLPGNGDAAPSAEAARILAGLRSANTHRRAALGFEA